MIRRNEVAVGLLVTVAVVLGVVGSLWLAHGGLSRGYPLYTRFAWGSNLKEGQPVLLAGISVGYVSDVKLRRDGYLDVTMDIIPKYTVPSGSTAAVQPVGIFGDVAIALTPPNPVPATDFAKGDTVPPGTPIPGISDILLRVDSIGTTTLRLERAIESDFIESGGLKDVRKASASALALSTELQHVLATQSENATETMAAFRSTAAEFAASAHRLSTMLDTAKLNTTLNNVALVSANAVRITAQFDTATRQLRRLLTQVDSGQGSAALFLHDPRLYNNTNDALMQIQGLVDDLEKHPRKYLNFSLFGGGGGK